jgi:hypothetical protein
MTYEPIYRAATRTFRFDKGYGRIEKYTSPCIEKRLRDGTWVITSKQLTLDRAEELATRNNAEHKARLERLGMI